MLPFKKYNFCFFFIIIFLVFSTFIFNFFVDPWGLVHNNRFAAPERIGLSYYIRKNNFETMILGSSRTRYLLRDQGSDGLVDTSKTLPSIFENNKVFVAALSGANIYVMKRVIDHTLILKNLKNLILVIDFSSMNDRRPNGNGWKDERFEGAQITEGQFSKFSNFLSFEMLKSSYNFLKVKNSKELIKKERSYEIIKSQWTYNLSEFLRYDLYGCYTTNSKTWGYLETMFKNLKANNVKVKVIIPGLHYSMYEMIFRTGNWDKYKFFLKNVKNINKKYDNELFLISPYKALKDIEVLNYDYQYHKEFFNSPNFFDPGHLNGNVGKDIIRFIHGFPIENKQLNKNIIKLEDQNYNVVIRELEKERAKSKNNFLLKEIMPNSQNTSFCN